MGAAYLATYLENKGSRLAYDEFHVGTAEFGETARRINKQASSR